MEGQRGLLLPGYCILLWVGIDPAHRPICQDGSAERNADVARSIAKIKSRFGTQVHYTFDPKVFFPDAWREDPLCASGRQIELSEALRTVGAVEVFLSKYSVDLVRENLADIFLMRSLSFYGREYGGTYSADGIYIVNEGEREGYDNDALESLLHGEFSSILFTNYDFPFAQWTAVNEEGWEYTGYGTNLDILGQEGLRDPSIKLLSKGFLNRYAMASVEEDFNMYVEALIERRPWLLAVASQHARVRQKLKLVAEFYKGIDPGCYLAKELEGIAPAGDKIASGTSGHGAIQAQHPELPADVFATPPLDSVIISVGTRRRITVDTGTRVTVSGPATIEVTYKGQILITIEP